MRIFIYIIILIILSPLWADENPEVKETEKVRVVGKKDKDEYESLEGTEKNPSGFSSVIPLEDTKDKYNSIDEVLEKESGLRVRRYGGLGAYSTLSIRGANPNQVKFYIDGVPINNNVGGEINLAELPFENLESIEVHKSGSSYGLSSSSVGGAVNLKTRKGKKKKKESRILLGGGSFHTIKGTVSHYDNTGEDLGYGFLASSEKSDGDFRFRNDNGTPVINTYDDYDDIRKNSWYERSAVSGTVNLKKGNTEYKLFNDFLYRMYGLPGQSNRTEKVKRKYLRNTSALGSTSKGIGFDNLNLSTRLYYTGMRDQLFDPKEEITYSEPNSRADIQQYGIHLLPEIYLLSYHQILRFMFGLERETFKNDKRNTDDKIVEKLPRKFRSHDLVQLEDEFRFFKKRLRIIPSYKWEIYHDRYNENILKKDYYNLTEKDSSIQRLTSKKLGGLIVPYKEKHLEFAWKANVSEEYRMPDFLELFGERGSIIGNPNLNPEKSRNFDTGPVIELNYENLSYHTSLVYYSKNILDMIQYVPNSQFTLRPENIDSAYIKGFEWNQKLKLYKTWILKSNYTYQKAINTSDSYSLNGKYLPLRPMHEWQAGIYYKAEKLECGLENTFIGANYKDRTNEYQNYQEARWIYNTYFTYYLYKNKEKDSETEVYINFQIKNIGDKRISDIVGYPLPGRSYYAFLSAKF